MTLWQGQDSSGRKANKGTERAEKYPVDCGRYGAHLPVAANSSGRRAAPWTSPLSHYTYINLPIYLGWFYVTRDGLRLLIGSLTVMPPRQPGHIAQTQLLLNKQCSTSRLGPVARPYFCNARSLQGVLVDRHHMHKTSGIYARVNITQEVKVLTIMLKYVFVAWRGVLAYLSPGLVFIFLDVLMIPTPEKI